MYRLKTTANFNVGGGISGEVIHDSTLMGKGTSESPLKVDQSKFAKPTDLNGKQDTLISGTNIKTINNQSILGEGNITIEGSSGEGLSTEVKNAILDCFEHVAWIDTHGQDYYDALNELFFPAATLVSISAVFNQGQTVIYDNASLDSLKQYLTVTANYDDSSTETVTNYSLSGTLSAGTSIITVTYQGKTTTFTVYVTAVPTLSSINAVFTQGDNVIYPSDSLNTLKQYLVVTAVYTDSSTETLSDNDYTLSGTLSSGTSTITVSYSGKTTTFDVTVSQAVELSSISAAYTQSGTVYTSDTLDSLKADLVVTATYSDSSTRTVTDYTLSGTLAAGTSTITVTYEGKTTTFSVTVTAVTVTSIDAVFNQGSTKITEETALDDLKQYLVVTANYNNGTTSTVASTDYTLSGTLVEGTSTITVTYEGQTDTFDVTVTENLVPSGYTQVDYLTSAVHGTPSASHLTSTPYIKTNFPAVDTDIIDYSVELDFEPLFNDVNYIMFGGRDATTYSATTRGIVVQNNPSGEDSIIFGNIAGQTNCVLTYLGDQFPVNTRASFKIDKKDIYINGSLITTVAATSAIQLASKKWVLFGRNNNGSYDATTGGGNLSPMIGKIYSFAIKDTNGDYVLRYVPCKRNSDNVYGMYDTVSNTFFTSAISTAFSGGDD